MTKFLGVMSFAMPLILLAGCQRATPAGDNAVALTDVPTVPETTDMVPTTNGTSAKARMLAAAEPFEGLTETAFDPDQTKVEAAIAKVRLEAASVRLLLPTDAQKMFDILIGDIQRAGKNGNSADLALASVEIYRILVTQGAGASPVPMEVSLLDYAGFRFTANLKATPTRWSDMAASIDFAKQNWAVVKPKIKDTATVQKFQDALDNMAAATSIKEVERAQASATAELDLVDILEQSFNGR